MTDLFITCNNLPEIFKQLSLWAEWEKETLEDFHAFAQQFGGSPGRNALEFALREALRNHGITLEQFRADRQRAGGSQG